MLEGAQGDKVPSQIIFQMPKLGLMNVCSVLCGGGHRDGRETKAKEWLILNNFYNEVRDLQQQKHLAS